MNHPSYVKCLGNLVFLMTALASGAVAGEKAIASLHDMSDVELKETGFTMQIGAPVHIKAVGAGGDYGWTYKSGDMFAYAWVINADTRQVVWEMTADKTSKVKSDRTLDGVINLPAGSYEVYFSAAVFAYHTAFTHIQVDVDHRQDPLFGAGRRERNDFFGWLKGWWSDDIANEWNKRSKQWGIDLLVDESVPVWNFQPPKQRENVVFAATPLGDNENIRRGFALSAPMTLTIDAVGEGRTEGELNDFGWIVNRADRRRVWEMSFQNSSWAGGAQKNIRSKAQISLPKGEYVLYYVTDGSHSMTNWNDNPPYDPFAWGITLSAASEKEMKAFRLVPYTEDQNVIVSLVRARDNDYKSSGFVLRETAELRVYAIGELGSSRRQMADYGTILDANTRTKVWTMDFHRTLPAGGDVKNRFIDEVITLPRGSYLVTYQTDDTHSYGSWNADPPFDQEHYGITVMGAGDNWDPSIVSPYTEEREKNIVAQIIRPGDNVDASRAFSLDKVTRLRIYAIGEGQNREMYDYGWIEDARTGSTVWEMTYGMTFHAGGGRKNRMVNTTVLLDKGNYRLRFKSDDSHSFGNWNVDPPEDQQFWGITVYRDDGTLPPVAPHQPRAPLPPDAPRGEDPADGEE